MTFSPTRRRFLARLLAAPLGAAGVALAATAAGGAVLVDSRGAYLDGLDRSLQALWDDHNRWAERAGLRRQATAPSPAVRDLEDRVAAINADLEKRAVAAVERMKEGR